MDRSIHWLIEDLRDYGSVKDSIGILARLDAIQECVEIMESRLIEQHNTIKNLRRKDNMKLKEAIEQSRLELLEKFREVNFKYAEHVKLTSNTTRIKYLHDSVDKSLEVVPITDRFIIKDEIDGIKVVFGVKYPRKRKVRNYEVFYKIL